VPGLSGERFLVRYEIAGTSDEAKSLAELARVEQSVEFPAELVPDGDIRECLVGRLESLEECGEQRYLASISFAVESAGAEFTQLLNLVWGTGNFFAGFRVKSLRACCAISAGRVLARPACANWSACGTGPCSAPPSSPWASAPSILRTWRTPARWAASTS
jgi:hypothetical protein